MATNRMEILLSMVDRNPADAFSRYGLAMEYLKAGDLLTAADHFQQVIEHNPNYAAAYFHGGQTLEKLGRTDEARAVYRRGIEVTDASGDEHTRNEIQAALTMLG